MNDFAVAKSTFFAVLKDKGGLVPEAANKDANYNAKEYSCLMKTQLECFSLLSTSIFPLESATALRIG